MLEELGALLIRRLGHEPRAQGKVPPVVYLDLAGRLYDGPAVSVEHYGVPHFTLSRTVEGPAPGDRHDLYGLFLVKGAVFLRVETRSSRTTFHWDRGIRKENLDQMARLKIHLETASDDDLIVPFVPAINRRGRLRKLLDWCIRHRPRRKRSAD